ncbi:SGNH hydrolase [Fomitiporia mediterranea MF3/22]|uniref:SGNH hydrolase n=1 Tax=Fomitiporia mediterranea (strain MF3/22) TaxID=694068 RepID=UPI0004408BDA|nr:SGNH hydrolase [Fomitiporia mediterranea MF3/22]EJD04852.1 SGNH hydrolase [Fomitiporia mediterranea MF3/22]
MMRLAKVVYSLVSFVLYAALAQEMIQNNHPLIHFHGRWDDSPGSWWASTGFKLNIENLKSLTLNLGLHTTSPSAPIGVSVDYGPFSTVNVSAGSNVIPLVSSITEGKRNTVVRINSEAWQNNRLNLESIELNSDAKFLPYTPSKLTFQFIGDSLSAGQYLPQGVDQAWPFLVSEAFKAEHVIIAQPGIALTDIPSYGNPRGMSVQFFDTEDAGYIYSMDHNYTTPWNFRCDLPTPDVVVIHIGANDNGQNVPAETFVQNYLDFLAHLRKIYKTQPMLLFTPWGWPQPDGSISYYYQGKYEEILSRWQKSGGRDTFLVNATGWVSLEDVFPDNLHPTVSGHQKIAGLFEEWLNIFGIHPQEEWETLVH